jgi:hypothetical protein
MGSFGRKLQRRDGRGGKELRVFELHSTDTLEELEASTREAAPKVLADKNPFYATVSGYDHDPRELWQVPEVVALFERVIASGMIGLLGDNRELGDKSAIGGFIDYRGAFLLARGAVIASDVPEQGGRAWLTPEMQKEMIAVLETANEKVDQLLGKGGDA